MGVTPESPVPESTATPSASRLLPYRMMAEVLGGLVLLGGVGYFLAVSWRRWPDPLVDFGRELYTPWRLAGGAVLFRDLDCYYGPLSQHVNAAVFALFGPGVMHLVAANLVIYAGILGLLYALFRRGWGPGAAWTASAVFIAVFSFSQLTLAGNFNYATPYAHETTHGLLVCLLLVVCLLRWIKAVTGCVVGVVPDTPPGALAPALPSRGELISSPLARGGAKRRGVLLRATLAGLCFGLTIVLKPEVILAGGLATAAAVAIAWRHRWRPRASELGAWTAGAVLPVALFTAWFARELPFVQALAAANGAWWNVVAGAHLAGEVIEAEFIGFDQLRRNLGTHALGSAIVLAIAAIIGATAWWCSRAHRSWRREMLGGAVALGIAAGVWSWVPGANAGRCLSGLVVIYLAVKLVGLARGSGAPGVATRKPRAC